MTGGELSGTLRQMLAVLETERQVLAALDLDGIVGATGAKDRLCSELDHLQRADLDEECRGLLDTARRLNEVNRQVRNILAANVTRRLDALTGSPQLYRASGTYAVAGARV
ncbi:flagellar protein FlgN [Novosphingobium sp. MBES04]|uniref:flagellar protein FlgN n=1 Tax=Novosphingobium sp. MBES04 TaxID=1206458 RepID=UPI00072328B4|nr:flagellar protein FlgN [Novosphingobium sp. MBES04]GAM03384.1 hypothetical conserved protein [Novosphingobium sp. MBES04]